MNTSLKKHVSSLEVTFGLVTIWSVVGFLYCYDNNTQFGCVNDNDVLSFHNLLQSAVTLALLALGFRHQNNALGPKFILAEFVYWILKPLFWKEGYVVGIGGSLPTDIATFDFIALLLRLFLLQDIFQIKLPRFWLLLPALIIAWVKIIFLR